MTENEKPSSMPYSKCLVSNECSFVEAASNLAGSHSSIAHTRVARNMNVHELGIDSSRHSRDVIIPAHDWSMDANVPY